MLTPDDPPPATTASGQRSVAVGGEVRDSTIITGDSNTIIIGPPGARLRVPWRRILVIAVPLLAVSVAAFILYPRPIPTMSGDLNVAVAEFGALNAQGAAVESADARALADGVFGTLTDETQAISQALGASEQRFNIQLWGPSRIGRISGNTPEERADVAQKVATPSKVHLLVYGYLEQRPDAATFVPQFYLRNLADTPELEGEHDLGRSVAVRSMDDPFSRARLRTNLTARTQAFTEFVIGLSQFTNDKWADARVHFMKADADPRWDEDGGKEVLYLFAGYTAGKLGDLAGARAYFQRAIALQPEVARAYLGLGEVQFQESLGKPDACAKDQVNVLGVQEAASMYQRALSAKVQPARSNVQMITSLSLGRAYLCLAQADAGNYWADAERELRAAIADYQPGDESARYYASDAHSNLGFVLLPARCDPQRDARYRASAQEYQQAIDLGQFHPERLGFYYEMLGFIDTQLGALDQARAAYRDAARVDPDNKDRYQQLLQNVLQPAAETCP
jgi:tetratricopeptide (TPR) repeat protein